MESDVTNHGNMFTIADTLVVGDLNNNGTVFVQYGVFTVVGNFTGSGTFLGGFGGRDGSHGLKVRGDLALSATASVTLPGGVLELAGDFDVAIEGTERFDLTAATLQMNAGPVREAVGEQTLEVLAADQGRNIAMPSATVCSLDKLQIGPKPTTVRLVDRHRNNPAARQVGPEAVYVKHLTLDPGVTLDLDGLHLYYEIVSPEEPLSGDSGVSVIDSAGRRRIDSVPPSETMIVPRVWHG